MPRPRYQISDEDAAVVHRWVRAKFRETAWEQCPLDHPLPSNSNSGVTGAWMPPSGSNCTR